MSAKREPVGGQNVCGGGHPMLGMLGIPIRRRSLLQGGFVAATGLSLGDHLRAPARAAESAPAKAKSIIQLWLWGGPSHIDAVYEIVLLDWI